MLKNYEKKITNFNDDYCWDNGVVTIYLNNNQLGCNGTATIDDATGVGKVMDK